MTIEEALNIADSGDRTENDPLAVLAEEVRRLRASERGKEIDDLEYEATIRLAVDRGKIIERLTAESAVLRKTPNTDLTPIELALCEAHHLALRPNQLYRFIVMPGCAKCARLAALYPTNKCTP